MAEAIHFSSEQRALIRDMRIRRQMSWDLVSSALGVSRSRAIAEGVGMGLAHSSTARIALLQEARSAAGAVCRREARGVFGGEALPAWHSISRGVLAEAGLPVPRVGEVW